MNGLEPIHSSLPQAGQLLGRVLASSTERPAIPLFDFCAQSTKSTVNPVFDFCVQFIPGSEGGNLMMCETALIREDGRLPW